MSLTLIRRSHGKTVDEPWIRADDWAKLADLLRVPPVESNFPEETMKVRWPDGRTTYHMPKDMPTLRQRVEAWAGYGFRWATITGASPRARTPNTTVPEDCL